MISVVYFGESFGGMHNYAKLVHEGYVLNNEPARLHNYFNGFVDYYRQTLKFLLHIKTNVEKWYYTEEINKSNIVHFSDTSLYIVFFIKKIYSKETKYIITIHNPHLQPRKGIKGKLMNYLTRILNNKILELSKKKKNIFIHLHSENQKPNVELKYIYAKHPISNKYSEYKKITFTKINEPISFLFIGNLHYYKGVDIFINSIKHLDKSYRDKCNFTIAGKGDIKIPEEIKKITTIYNYFLSDQQFLEIMEKTHIIVLPYREATQSGILSFAVSLNKPVIITNVGNLSEYVLHMNTGIILNKLSYEDLINSYKYFIRNPNIIENMSTRTKDFKDDFLSVNTSKEILQQLELLSK